MNALDSLWASPAFLRDTLGTDAHTLDTSVFLAVHQPMRFRRVEYGRAVEEAPIVREQDMLEALLADDGEGRVIIPIAGPSGSGKSHVIRWLEAELRSRDDAEGRHVILVPKNSSLKSVLRLILRDLEGPRYDKIRKSLERASESLPEVTAKDLRTRLVSVLKSEANAAKERLRAGSLADRTADDQASWGPELAALLEDPELWNRHFYGEEPNPTGVLARLAENVTRDGSTNRRHQFEADDFDGLASVVDVSDLSPGARRPISRLTAKKYQQIAADVLNGVLDQATQNLLDLGGTPLSEVFLELRRALLEGGKELVILVEDFAVLSGMQGALLDALVHEARVGGRREYCAIRSALAYTHGFQPMQRDTVRTRARAEWVIEDVPGEKREILDRAVELVGAYWNAARWGLDALREQHEQASGQKNWVQCYEPADIGEDESRIIDAFGRSGAGYPLFPLNAEAIRQLVREKCFVNERLVFNPRLIIDRVVLDVGKLRPYFKTNKFPPLSIGNSVRIAAEVAQVINRQPADQRERALTLVTYWAELPESIADAARLPGAVYEAFGLRPVDFGAPAPVLTEKPKGDPPGPTPVPVDPFDADWRPILDDWQGGKRLEQARARDLRNWLSDAVLSTLAPDWPGSRPCVDKTVVAKDKTYLPHAMGAGGLDEADAAISLCGDDVWSDPLRAAPIRQALEAMIRFHGIDETKGTWNYSGAETHAARYANFVAARRGKLVDWFATMRRSQQNQQGFLLCHLAENRLMAAAVLGIGVKGGDHLESAMDVLFKDLPNLNPNPGLPERWRRLLDEAHQNGERSRADLIELVAARQGRQAGSKLLALDVASLQGPVREFLKKWELSDGPKDQNSFARTTQRGIKARQSQLKDWRTKTNKWLGEEFDKQATLGEIRELLTESNQLALCHTSEIVDIRKLLDQFRDARVTEALEHAEFALRESQDGTTLPNLAYDYSKVVQVTNDLGTELEQLFEGLEKNIESTLEATGVVLVQAMTDQVTAEFKAIRAILNDYMEIRSHEGS